MQKKKNLKKSKKFFTRKVDTKFGTLIIILFSFPVVLLSNSLVRTNEQINQKVNGITTTNYASQQNNTTAVDTATGTSFSCPPGAMCSFPSVTPSCYPRPSCLDAIPRCYPPVPINGWCPQVSPTPYVSLSPSPTPPSGCYYQHICLMMLKIPCDTTNHNCQPCRTVLVCPSGTPKPVPSCIPQPTCNPRLGIACKLPIPCTTNTAYVPVSPTQIPYTPTSTANSIFTILNTFLRTILGR